MNAPVACQSYQQTQIETASPERLLLMLYTAALWRLESAKTALQQKDYRETHTLLTKVQDIVLELMVSLDWETASEICSSLHSLYDYVYRRLVQATIHRDIGAIDEAIQILTDLQTGWEQVILNQKPAAHGTVPASKLNIQG